MAHDPIENDISIDDFETFAVEMMRPPQKRCTRDGLKSVCPGTYSDPLCRACALRAKEEKEKLND